MAVIYANRIIKYGQSSDPDLLFTIDNVPSMFKISTLTNLSLRDYDGYGLPL